ncbi:MAG: hypothetical protein NC489_23280 [Ruminococcus flavefaciens]|nr:hypothetical protein [Eubacterium sp.]MCM1233057.1 hypothetical protein [Ruminococcus flavefaciens]
MYFAYKKLIDNLKLYENIIIYGIGQYAHEIYPVIVKYGLKDKILCFVQSQDNNIKIFDGICVKNIASLDCDMRKSVILIAVSELYTNELVEISSAYGFRNIVKLVDYELSERQYNEQFEEQFTYFHTFEEYCEAIAEWYVEEHTEECRKGMIVQRLLDRSRVNKVDTNQIVMICGHFSSRTVKIAGALKKKNIDVILLDYSYQETVWNSKEVNDLEIPIHKCRRIEEFLYMLLQFTPLVYFFEPRWSDCKWAAIVLKNKKCFGKIVLGLYDVMNYEYVGVDEEKLQNEKYALENADGIVWRWFAKEYLEEKGFQYSGKSIQFPDYCKYVHEQEKINDTNSDMVKLCLVGGNGNMYVDSREYSTDYSDFARLDEILDKIGNRKDCCFHFYAGWLSDKNIERCKQYERVYNNFKFYIGVEHGQLVQKLAEYDYGCEFWGYEKMPEPPKNIPMGKYYGSMYHDCIRNAFFDYISAGLAIVTTQSSKLWDFLAPYNIVINMDLYNLDMNYLIKEKKHYKEIAKTSRNELDIDVNITKLIRFFGEL